MYLRGKQLEMYPPPAIRKWYWQFNYHMGANMGNKSEGHTLSQSYSIKTVLIPY